MCVPIQQQRQRCLSRGRTSRTTVSGIGRSSSSAFCRYLLLSVFLCCSMTMRDDFHLKFLGVVNALAFAPRSVKKSRETRYFTKECLIPPLEPSEADNFANLTLHSDKIHFGPLPVVYTNDPKTVGQWIRRHVPTSEKCTIGFDVEVGHRCRLIFCLCFVVLPFREL